MVPSTPFVTATGWDAAAEGVVEVAGEPVPVPEPVAAVVPVAVLAAVEVSEGAVPEVVVPTVPVAADPVVTGAVVVAARGAVAGRLPVGTAVPATVVLIPGAAVAGFRVAALVAA